MDAVALLRADHRTVEKLFKQFEKLEKQGRKSGGGAKEEQRDVVDQIVQELSIHAAIEEQVFYPAVREEVESQEDTVLESLEEHHVVKWVLSELEGMPPDAERFAAKTMVLIEAVRHHVEEEEQELFPEVREAMGRKRLIELGELLEKAKGEVPARPQPKAPDTPAGRPAKRATKSAKR